MERPAKKNYHLILLNKLGNLDDYTYAGGFKSKLNEVKNNYMLKLESEGIEYPQIKKNCECTHWIMQNCYVMHIETKKVLVIGNCCIKHFQIKKRCSDCKRVHKRTKSNICNECEKQIKEKDRILSTKLNFGKYKGFSIGYVEKHDINYLKWIYENFDINKKHKSNSEKIYDYYNFYSDLVVAQPSDTS